MAQSNYQSTCPDCSDLGGECDTCFFVGKNDQIIESLKTMGQNKPENTLYEVAAIMAAKKTIADKEKEMIKKLRELAKDYSNLELSTQRVVRTIQSYGENCKEAAEDFLEDGNLGELLDELVDVEASKTSLAEVTQKHNDIK